MSNYGRYWQQVGDARAYLEALKADRRNLDKKIAIAESALKRMEEKLNNMEDDT